MALTRQELFDKIAKKIQPNLSSRNRMDEGRKLRRYS